MDINNIKENVRNCYMQVVSDYITSQEYTQNRKKQISKIRLEILILIFINVLLYTRGIPYVDDVSGYYLVFAIIMSLFIIIYLPIWLYSQSISRRNNIKKHCVKNILQNFAGTKNSNNCDSKNMPNEIIYDDILDFDFAKDHCSYEFFSLFLSELFVGHYNNIPYNIHGMGLGKGISTKRGYIQRINNEQLDYSTCLGLILKTTNNTNINGWISVCTKEGVEKRWTFKDYFCLYLFAPCILLLLWYQFISMIPNYQYVYAILFTLIAIISYIVAKYKVKEGIIYTNVENKQERNTDIVYLNEKVSIKASEDIKDVNSIVTPEFVDMLEKLKILFNNPKIYCKFSDNNTILAIYSYKSMLEAGGLFTSPVNEKIVEKFVSQMTGILLFLEYVSNLNNNSD